MKIYKKKTGIQSRVDIDADYFRVSKVILIVEHAPSKKELQDGKNMAIRPHEIDITDDKDMKMLTLELYKNAIEQ